MRFASLLIVILAPCGAGGIAHADVYYMKDVTLPAFEGEELVAVPLDSDVYLHSTASYADLRLLTADNEQVPYIIRRAQIKRSRTSRRTWGPQDLAVKPLEDGGLEIRFRSDLARYPQPPQGIRFYTPVSNFEHHVRVEVSNDGNQWRTVVDDGLIFDYSQFMDVRNLAVEPLNLGDDKPEYYRLTIADVTQEQQSQLLELTRSLSGDDETNRTERVTINRQPFRIDRIELWHDEVREDIAADLEVDFPLEVERTEPKSAGKRTCIYLKSGREPLTSFALQTDTRNFSRQYSVEVPEPAAKPDPWRAIASGNISRLDFRTLKREALTMSIPETRETQYRIVIDNRDNPPLDIATVTAKGYQYQVIFLAASDGKYRLAYGDSRLQPPSYDTVALTASVDAGFTPLLATLEDGVEVDIPLEAVPPEPFWKWLLNNTWLMTGVIGVLVLILAAGLYRATGQLENFDDSQ